MVAVIHPDGPAGPTWPPDLHSLGVCHTDSPQVRGWLNELAADLAPNRLPLLQQGLSPAQQQGALPGLTTLQAAAGPGHGWLNSIATGIHRTGGVTVRNS
jgi:hypothetical protein